MVKKTTRFDLASASSSLTTNNVCTLHIPVRDVHGHLRIAVEKGALTTEVDETLLASAKRRLSLLENGAWMKMTGLHSETFKVPVDQSGDLPTVHFPTNEIAAASTFAVIPSCVQTAFTGRQGGGEKKSVGSREEANQEKRRKFLYLLHLRFVHSTGLCLLNTLKEKGVGGGYMLKECSDMCEDCFACKAFNMRNRRIGRRRVRANQRERQKQKRKPKEPSKSDSQVEKETSEGSAERAPSLGDLSIHFNHEVVHDLTFPKQKDMGGEVGMSVIIDKSSCRVSLRSFKRKYESSRHLLFYHRRWEKKGRGVKEVFTDNGGEFVGEEYQETVERIGAALIFGPPYTPEAQAEVERVNQTVKRLLKKIILQLRVPPSCWLAFIPGVENAINETIHSTTRFSPNAVVHGVSEGVPPLAVRDVVRFLEKGPIPSGLAPNSSLESAVDRDFFDESDVQEQLDEEIGDAEKEMDLLRGLIQMDEPEYIDDGDLYAYVGLSVRVKEGEMSLEQLDYIADMVSHLSLDEQKPLTARDLLLDDPEEEMEEGLRREQQKEVGALGWASKTQPHLSFLFSHMSRMNGKPTKRTLRAVRRALWHAFSHARPLRLIPVKGKPCLIVWVDASYETRQKQGRLGYEFQIAGEGDLKDLFVLGEENTVA
uniref:Integrase catalytic domain-containing protein n=1 Tax=Chromera velia CCMP2878 TaxID=1169474 RepID=A0A0G4G714_9ALVE|eukprot:Cvel_4265.t1-p1 / transcript=Cvel_4265.t1 / gene=Cvel_4265 / organism=Chromera_velia_CCMP2878 / gene_product=Retrotransposable element Tf2 155 kDa protein type, putative / transcript_product=Retrotransposable element Tf2 155 kDa protein type, putative / location=Cvel_scaffold185:5088-8618(-) / protein_length=652 / sequence_SO=supercontig / SO=protein_coding / is_pseudo=false